MSDQSVCYTVQLKNKYRTLRDEPKLLPTGQSFEEALGKCIGVCATV